MGMGPPPSAPLTSLSLRHFRNAKEGRTTERGRSVISDAMDIHGGAAICVGHNNFLEKYYKSVPIGITVEGSNTLTRSLIIFAQGLNKSHPHIYPLLKSILANDLDTFKENFNNIISHSLNLYFKTFGFSEDLEQQIINFAALTNFVALKGGAIKREQMLSGDMADIFGNLYLAISVRNYHKNYKASEKLTNYIVQRLLLENQEKINKIIDNLGYERYLLSHLKKNYKAITYDNEREIFDEIMENENIINEIQKNIHKTGVLKDYEEINRCKENSKEYILLKEKIINVNEFREDNVIQL